MISEDALTIDQAEQAWRLLDRLQAARMRIMWSRRKADQVRYDRLNRLYDRALLRAERCYACAHWNLYQIGPRPVRAIAGGLTTEQYNTLYAERTHRR